MWISRAAPIAIGILLCAVLGAFYIYKGRDSDSVDSQRAVTASSTDSSSSIMSPPSGWREYVNAYRAFRLYYPPEFTQKEYDEGSGTYTITFEPEGGGKGFQLFMTPYLGDSITQSRLLKDIPNGSFTTPRESVLGDGTRALRFESQGPLGKMQEVWFLHDGYLFEITGYVELEAQISEVVRTWSFLSSMTAE